MVNITPIIEAVLKLLAAIIIAVAIPYVKSCTTVQQQAEISAWVKIAVTAAEQIYTGPGKGVAKKAYVLDWLHAHGVTVDEDKLDAMVESTVYAMRSTETGKEASA